MGIVRAPASIVHYLRKFSSIAAPDVASQNLDEPSAAGTAAKMNKRRKGSHRTVEFRAMRRAFVFFSFSMVLTACGFVHDERSMAPIGWSPSMWTRRWRFATKFHALASVVCRRRSTRLGSTQSIWWPRGIPTTIHPMLLARPD
jgi:hypothetical protein